MLATCIGHWRGSNSSTFNVTCFFCDQKGHIKAECPERRRSQRGWRPKKRSVESLPQSFVTVTEKMRPFQWYEIYVLQVWLIFVQNYHFPGVHYFSFYFSRFYFTCLHLQECVGLLIQMLHKCKLCALPDHEFSPPPFCSTLFCSILCLNSIST